MVNFSVERMAAGGVHLQIRALGDRHHRSPQRYRDLKLHSTLFGWRNPDQALRVAAGRHRNPFRSFMNLLLSQTVAVLALACALTLNAEVSNGAEVGQTPVKMQPPLDGALQAKALMEEAASLIGEGKDQQALAKPREAVAIDPQSPIRVELEHYDAHPKTGLSIFLAVVQSQVKEDRLLAADQTNRLAAITLPKLEPAERARIFKSAVSSVLEQHGFTSPQFIEKAGSLWTAVGSRPRLRRLGESGATSPWEVLQAIIETTPDNQVTLDLVPYAWIGSDYAILGRIPQIKLGITRERAEIGRQLQAALDR